MPQKKAKATGKTHPPTQTAVSRGRLSMDVSPNYKVWYNRR